MSFPFWPFLLAREPSLRTLPIFLTDCLLYCASSWDVPWRSILCCSSSRLSLSTAVTGFPHDCFLSPLPGIFLYSPQFSPLFYCFKYPLFSLNKFCNQKARTWVAHRGRSEASSVGSVPVVISVVRSMCVDCATWSVGFRSHQLLTWRLNTNYVSPLESKGWYLKTYIHVNKV